MIEAFFNEPFLAQFFVAFVLLFFFFILVIWLKEAIIRNKLESNSIARVIFYPLGLLFLICDAGFNLIYGSVLFLEPANKHNQGWLFTSRIQYHTRNSIGWRYALAVWIARHLNNVHPGHVKL